VSGVGKKKAERIALELGDKLEDMVPASVAAEPESALVDSAVSALLALGYARSEAEGAVRDVLRDRDGADEGVESLVREALAGLS
jgi:Holliday junction resolvasome RuvABC DNA-binding subunit